LVFRLDPNTGKETVLYTFTGGADGGEPVAGLIQDAAGIFYGTASAAGNSSGGICGLGCGVVFKLNPTTGDYTVLYTFTGGADGGTPAAGLIRDADGNLYGTTENAGTSGWGVVFKLDTTGKETVLHSFTGGADGATPRASLILDSAGNLYGTTYQGGAPCGSFTCGVIFKVDATGNETVLHTFTGGDGGNPEAGLLRDSSGNLYGTSSAFGTTSTGSPGYGTIFKLDAKTSEETVLYTFTGESDGAQPIAGLVSDSTGSLYGTTQNAGDFSNCIADGCGLVFKLASGEASFNVAVILAGNGNGTATSSPAGINCGTSCSANFVNGSTVALSATAAGGSDFSGWSGACSGEGGCTVTASASVTATFNALPPDFSLTTASVSFTVQPGGQGTDVITIASQNGSFGNAILLSCAVAGPSPMPTCALSPMSVTPGSGSGTSMLTITAPSSAMLRPAVGRYFSSSLYAVWLPLATVGMIPILAAKKKRRRWMPCGFLLSLLLSLAACGGSAGSNRVTQQGSTSYTITVNGTSGTIQHATQVMVTVQ
jgi:uncharacterized repeat protein (TIGR03803 family)